MDGKVKSRPGGAERQLREGDEGISGTVRQATGRLPTGARGTTETDTRLEQGEESLINPIRIYYGCH